jgi:thymidylate kinase
VDVSSSFAYIAVDGPIGVGKSALVERLAQRLEARAVLEEWSQNPFLKGFYEGSPGAAFQSELFFLLSRYKQQQELLQRKLFAPVTIVDFVFEKSKLFAYLNLDDSEVLLYEKLFDMLVETVPRPDLVVYLQASTEVLMKRIRSRGRPEEDQLSGGVPGRGEPRLQLLLLPLHADAAPRREHDRPRFRLAPRRRRRPPEADPRDGQGHALLRSARLKNPRSSA